VYEVDPNEGKLLQFSEKKTPLPAASETQLKRFWRRISSGLRAYQMWTQFAADARFSYRLFAREIDSTRKRGTGRLSHFLNMANQLFWAIIDKLSPARRVMMLIAMVLLFSTPNLPVRAANGMVRTITIDGPFWSALLLLGLLLLEVTDRVVMKRDLQIAKEIQSWLLPTTPPIVPGLEIDFMTRPANTVAGDYYDIFAYPSSKSSGEQAFLLAIADVVGKSVPAAMLMATFQASLKTLARTSGSLNDLVGLMNSYACGNSQKGRRFTTAFIAEYDPLKRQLIYVNAGHNPPILRRQSGAVERLTAGGVPLGIMEPVSYESGVVTLECGDWLVIFTDGVTEAENHLGEEYGEDRLLVPLSANASLGAPALLQAILDDLDEFVGQTQQHDDVTLMLLKVC